MPRTNRIQPRSRTKLTFGTFFPKTCTWFSRASDCTKKRESPGVEFPAGGRFIDILAVDPNGGYVVIELKVPRGYDRTVGQLRRYMGRIKMHHAEPAQAVRGIIVARGISEDLVLACSGLSDVALFEYEMSVSLKKIQ